MKHAFPTIMAWLVDEWAVAVAIGLVIFGLGAALVGGQTTATVKPVPSFLPALAIGVVLIGIGAAIIFAPVIARAINRRAAAVRSKPARNGSNDED